MINYLIIFSVNSGLWLAIVAVAIAAVTVSEPFLDFQFHGNNREVDKATLTDLSSPIAVLFGLSPLYCNTVLANLNARAFVKSAGYSTTKDSSVPVIMMGLSNSSHAGETAIGPTTITHGLENRPGLNVPNPVSFTDLYCS
jgi:hypothetical protein